MVFPVGRIVGSTAIDRNVCQIILFSVDVAKLFLGKCAIVVEG